MNGNTAAKRDNLRKQVIKLRSAQRPPEVVYKSELICATLEHIPELQRAGTIMAYAAIKQEADINGYWQEAWTEGKTIVLPRVNGELLEAVRFQGWDQTRPGAFGIWEPEGEPFPPERIEAVLIPGVVFDGEGYRLGYGKGYYDWFLSKLLPSSFFCGIAYELQLVDDIFPASWDVRLHALVTENQVIRFSKSSR